MEVDLSWWNPIYNSMTLLYYIRCTPLQIFAEYVLNKRNVTCTFKSSANLTFGQSKLTQSKRNVICELKS